MRVLHVTGAYVPSTAYGGPIVATHLLLAAQARAGATVDVLTTDADGRRRLRSADVALDGVGIRYYRTVPLNSHGMAPGLCIEALRSAAAYDVVHCHGISLLSSSAAAWGAWLSRRALVVSPHGAMMAWARRKKLLRKRAYALLDAIPFRAGWFHAASEREAADIRDLGYRAFTVPHGVDAAFLQRPVALDIRAHLSIPADVRLVAWVGRLDPVKNLEVLVEALQSLPLVHLVLGGEWDNAYGRRIREQAKAKGVPVHFIGYVEGEVKRALLQQANVFAAPSHMESYGMAIAEALACGCPVVASTGTPWRDLDTFGAGYWVAPTSGAFSSAIGAVLSAGTSEMRARARSLATRHDWDARARAMLDEYAGCARTLSGEVGA